MNITFILIGSGDRGISAPFEIIRATVAYAPPKALANTQNMRSIDRGAPLVTNMEENEGWAMFRRTIIIVAILLLFLAPIFLYVYLERGLEGAIDFFADRIIGVMFAGLLAGAFVLFDKLSNKLFNKQD